MPNDAPDPCEMRKRDESSPGLFAEHYAMLAIWIASVVVAIVALAR